MRPEPPLAAWEFGGGKAGRAMLRKLQPEAPPPEGNKRLESLGDAVWRVAVAEHILETRGDRALPAKLNTNAAMAAWAKTLGLKPATGGSFERHVAALYRKDGMPAVRRLFATLVG